MSMQGYPSRLLALSEQCPPAMQQREHWCIKDFLLVREVGTGAASTVYYGVCRKSCLPCAIKMYNKSKLTRLNKHQVDREVNIHSSLKHPHIIDFYAAFEDDDRVYMVMEFAAGGDLFDEVKRRGGRLSENEVVRGVLYPYLTALGYLHGRGIIHRDIKPENTVFTRDKVMKVTDFGLAVDGCMERPVTRLGTLDYMAPEVLVCPDKHAPEDNKHRADLAYGAAVDAWAMGVLAYELIVGRPPFGMSSRDATMRAIAGADPALPEWLSMGAADFISGALAKGAAGRSTVAQLLHHPWILAHIGSTLYSQPSLACSTGSSAAAFHALDLHPHPHHLLPTHTMVAMSMGGGRPTAHHQVCTSPPQAAAAIELRASPPALHAPQGRPARPAASHERPSTSRGRSANDASCATAAVAGASGSGPLAHSLSAVGGGESDMQQQQQRYSQHAGVAEWDGAGDGFWGEPLGVHPQPSPYAQPMRLVHPSLAAVGLELGMPQGPGVYGMSPPVERPSKRSALQRCASAAVMGHPSAWPSTLPAAATAAGMATIGVDPASAMMYMQQPAQPLPSPAAYWDGGYQHQQALPVRNHPLLGTMGGSGRLDMGGVPKGHDCQYWCTDGVGWAGVAAGPVATMDPGTAAAHVGFDAQEYYDRASTPQLAELLLSCIEGQGAAGAGKSPRGLREGSRGGPRNLSKKRTPEVPSEEAALAAVMAAEAAGITLPHPAASPEASPPHCSQLHASYIPSRLASSSSAGTPPPSAIPQHPPHHHQPLQLPAAASSGPLSMSTAAQMPPRSSKLQRGGSKSPTDLHILIPSPASDETVEGGVGSEGSDGMWGMAAVAAPSLNTPKLQAAAAAAGAAAVMGRAGTPTTKRDRATAEQDGHHQHQHHQQLQQVQAQQQDLRRPLSDESVGTNWPPSAFPMSGSGNLAAHLGGLHLHSSCNMTSSASQPQLSHSPDQLAFQSLFSPGMTQASGMADLIHALNQHTSSSSPQQPNLVWQGGVPGAHGDGEGNGGVVFTMGSSGAHGGRHAHAHGHHGHGMSPHAQHIRSHPLTSPISSVCASPSLSRHNSNAQMMMYSPGAGPVVGGTPSDKAFLQGRSPGVATRQLPLRTASGTWHRARGGAPPPATPAMVAAQGTGMGCATAGGGSAGSAEVVVEDRCSPTGRSPMPGLGLVRAGSACLAQAMPMHQLAAAMGHMTSGGAYPHLTPQGARRAAPATFVGTSIRGPQSGPAALGNGAVATEAHPTFDALMAPFTPLAPPPAANGLHPTPGYLAAQPPQPHLQRIQSYPAHLGQLQAASGLLSAPAPGNTHSASHHTGCFMVPLHTPSPLGLRSSQTSSGHSGRRGEGSNLSGHSGEAHSQTPSQGSAPRAPALVSVAAVPAHSAHLHTHLASLAHAMQVQAWGGGGTVQSAGMQAAQGWQGTVRTEANGGGAEAMVGVEDADVVQDHHQAHVWALCQAEPLHCDG